MLEEVARIFEHRAREAGLRFALELDAELPQYIKADRGKLYNILLNLVSNAVKHTYRGGISLRAESSPLTGNPTMTWLRLEVEDSGEGIAPEEQPRIFDVFYQAGHPETGVKGSGLGLTIVKSYLEMMDGRISVESTPGKGSLFRVDVPVRPSAASDVIEARPAGQAVLGLASGEQA